jgi:hypothetical protein
MKVEGSWDGLMEYISVLGVNLKNLMKKILLGGDVHILYIFLQGTHEMIKFGDHCVLKL